MSRTPSHPTEPAWHGVLLVRKPAGRTSFDLVRAVMGWVRPLKVGHTGTLDPMATGLLPLTIGEATKISRFLMGGPKRYRARIRLGIATDTLDLEGTPSQRAEVPTLTDGQLGECLAAMTGTVLQVPPMFSAIRHHGRRMYDLAREGVEVERQPRPVEIFQLDMLCRGTDWLELDIRCGPGTYIRSLAADLAEKLGTVGHLESLERVEVAGWTLDEAWEWEDLDRDSARERILPLQGVLERFQCVEVDPEQMRRLAQGQRLSPAELALLEPSFSLGSVVWFRQPAGRTYVAASVSRRDDVLEMSFLRQVRCPDLGE